MSLYDWFCNTSTEWLRAGGDAARERRDREDRRERERNLDEGRKDPGGLCKCRLCRAGRR